MVDIGMVTPTNGVVSYGRPTIITEANVETAANMYPGRLVKRGTTDYDLAVCGATDTPIGWLGFEDTAAQFRPATPSTIYAASDKAAVIRGGGFVIDYAVLAISQTIVKGDALVTAADGTVQKATGLSGSIASGATPVTSTGAQPATTIAGDIGAKRIVGYAEVSVTTTSSTAVIKIRNNL